MGEEIIITIIKWAIPVILGALFSWIAGSISKMKKDDKAVKAGLLAIIRSQIVSKCESYQKKGFLPEYARFCLEDLHKQYKALGGNHGIEILVENTFNLPSSERKEE